MNSDVKKELLPQDLKNCTVEIVNHPPHYTQKKFEPIDVIEDWELNFNLGNIIKYVARAPYKGNALQDLQKARFYLDREITRLEADTL